MTYPPEPPKPGISAGHAVLGVFGFVVAQTAISMVVQGFLGWGTSLATGCVAVLGILMAFGGGFVLMRQGSRDRRGFGLGLMIGWGLATILTLGICTGMNPVLFA